MYAVLKILEQYFIKCSAPLLGKGNDLRENVVFAPGGSLTIHEDGKRRYQGEWQGVCRIDAEGNRVLAEERTACQVDQSCLDRTVPPFRDNPAVAD